MNIYYLKRLRGEIIFRQSKLKKNRNYISGQLISWAPNRSYYEAQYNYATKLYVVCDWKKTKGLPALANKEEAICNDQLVNFFKDAKHKNCSCSVSNSYRELIKHFLL